MTGENAWQRDPALRRALAHWLPEQRWFDGTGRPLASVAVLRVHAFHRTAARLGVLAVVAARDMRGADAGRYLLVLGVGAPHTPSPVPLLARTRDGRPVYGALADAELVDALVRRIAGHRPADGARYVAEPPGVALPAAPLSVRPLGAEQSNTSVVLDERYILKIFRRPTEGASPDLVLHRLLRDAGSPHVPQLLGAIEEEGTDATLATLQRFLPDAEDGWSAALDSVRGSLGGAPDPAAGDFTGAARRLGGVLADVHGTLAAAHENTPLGDGDCRQLSELFRERLSHAVGAVPQLAAYTDQLHSVFTEFVSLPGGRRPAQLTHGDLHLGQTLRTPRKWLLLDFEGEPQAGHEERIRLHSPMRDVAGMLRSFDYAAHHGLGSPDEDPAGHAAAERWVRCSQDAFLAGYTAVAGPRTPAESRLLRAYVLDKAVYEALYETRHRPSWAWIPLRSLVRGLR
ncbi:hypothetical protein [Streptomyces sp. NPDC059631]|uniref:maltokinase N-terminal cap-like domain-containing protein n=1 Tax=unclassified Streptomyces TaxID=2593676 RepID=UPI003687FABD